MIRSIFLSGVFLGLTTLSSALPVVPPSAHKFPRRQVVANSTVTWGPCSDPLPSLSNITCATYTVPLDWDNPIDNETIQLGMVRIQAADQSNRIGNLFINPGGPGGQASSIVSSIAETPGRLAPEILARFDIIGLDPRGVGLSTPVVCDVETYNRRVTFLPKTQEQFNALVQYNKDVAQSCRDNSGRLIDFVDTISAVKDHEAVRLALGGEKANFVGLSYGTQLFSQYAELYPNSFRAMVIDGQLQHSQSESSNLLIEATTSEATLKQLFKWCDASVDCPLQGQDIEARFLSVVAKARAAPIPAPGCTESLPFRCRSDVTAEEMLFNIQPGLTRTANWPAFAQAIIDADNGDATAFSAPLVTGDAYDDSSLFAGTAIQCQDWEAEATTLAEVIEKQAIGTTFAPVTEGTTQSYKIQTSCIGWSAPLTNPPKPIKYSGETPILMVNALNDPETSYTWAVGLQKEIGTAATLLTRNGSGHTSYLLVGGETNKLENAFLLDLTLPAPGTIVDS